MALRPQVITLPWLRRCWKVGYLDFPPLERVNLSKLFCLAPSNPPMSPPVLALPSPYRKGVAGVIRPEVGGDGL